MNDDTVVFVGKYKGHTLKYIKNNDLNYYNWISNLPDFKNRNPKSILKVKVEKKPVQKLFQDPIQIDSELTSKLRHICHFHLDWVYIRNENRVCSTCLSKNAPIPLVVKRRMQKLLNNGILI